MTRSAWPNPAMLIMKILSITYRLHTDKAGLHLLLRLHVDLAMHNDGSVVHLRQIVELRPIEGLFNWLLKERSDEHGHNAANTHQPAHCSFFVSDCQDGRPWAILGDDLRRRTRVCKAHDDFCAQIHGCLHRG